MQERRNTGDTLRAIADRLNRLGLRTPRGFEWHSRTVLTVLQRSLEISQVAA
jgi:hypothetical protein